MGKDSSSTIISQGQKVLEIEAQSILALKSRIGDAFVQAVEMIFSCKGKVILTGIGKSGQIARKIASTMSSTGTPALFLHPAEGSHGDIGLVASGDLVIGISYGGETPELNHILKYCARKNIPILAITGNQASALARSGVVVLDVNVPQEACPLNLAPTASSTATLAMGDALAMAVLARRGFQPEDFAENHPGGSLGFRLLTRVKDVMHKGDSLPVVKQGTPVREILSIMTKKDVRGAAGVIDDNGELVGVITDGDIRRRLEKSLDPLSGSALDLMSKNPRVIGADEMLESAMGIMQEHQIQLLFVVDTSVQYSRRPVGIVHIQDLLKANVR